MGGATVTPLGGSVLVTAYRVLAYIRYKLKGHAILAVSTKTDTHLAQTIW